MEKYIEVNKEVFISDEYIKAGTKDYVLNVSDLNEADGFTQFVLVFDGDQQCCEDAGINIIGENPFNNSLFIKQIKIEELNVYETENGWGIGEGGAMKVTLITEKKEYVIVFYNDHNGYYGHEISMKYLEDGQVEFEYEEYL